MKYLLLIIPFILFSCVTQDKCRTKFPCASIDTVKTEKYIYRDTMVYTQEEDMGYFSAILYCDSLNRLLIDSIVELNGKKVKISYIYKDKLLKVFAKVDSFSIYATLRDRYAKDVVVVTQPPPPQPKWYEYIKWILILILAIVLALVAYKAIPRR